MKILQVCTDPGAVILDCDRTLHSNGEYLKAGEQAELLHIARVLNGSVRHAEESLAGQGCHSRTESVLRLGLPRHWWNVIREDCYQPEKFLTIDPSVMAAVAGLQKRFKLAILSNNPQAVTKRALVCLGLRDLLPHLPVFGADNVPVSKNDSRCYQWVAERIGMQPQRCFMIGDREEVDGNPAAAAGMGAIIVSGPTETVYACQLLLNYVRPLDLGELSQPPASSALRIEGITGRAGSGKTTLAQKLATNPGVRHLSLDTFFRLSSRARKAWLAAGKTVSAEEYNRRADQMTWWNFDLAIESLQRLRAGRVLHLERVYNRSDGGELTGVVHIEPQESIRIFLEGVAIAHLRPYLDRVMMLHAPATTRFPRLKERDRERRLDEGEMQQRFLLTESFEGRYFASYQCLADTHIDTSNGVPIVLHAPPTP